MQQSSVNIKKALFYTQNNFFSQGATNSFSLDSVRNSGQKQTSHHSRVQTPKSLISNISNLQNLQTIKDQINHLQNSLQHTHNLMPNKSRDEKSFYEQIREQLKQVNKLQGSTSLDNPEDNNMNSNNVYQLGSRVQKRSNFGTTKVESKSMHTLGSKDKNASLLKNLLNVQSKESSLIQQNSSDRIKNMKCIKIEEKEIFYKQLDEINEQKKKQLIKLKQKYKEEKEKILVKTKVLYDKAKQQFDERVRQRIEELSRQERKKQNQEQKENWLLQKKLNIFQFQNQRARQQIIESSTSSFDSNDVMTPQNKSQKSNEYLMKQIEMDDDIEINKKKSTLVSSLKKEGSNSKNNCYNLKDSFNRKKKQKVRFKNDDQKEGENLKFIKFKTDEEEDESQSFDFDDPVDIYISKYD